MIPDTSSLGNKDEVITNTILKDLDIASVGSNLHFSTSWGKDTFISRLKNPIQDKNILKRRQMPLLALVTETTLRDDMRKMLKTIRVDHLADLLQNEDVRIKENVEQIIWGSESVGSILNQSPIVLNGLITWKTLVLPFIAVLMPLVALVLPFIILKMTSIEVSIEEYLERMRAVLMQQITIPVVLKSRNEHDIVGFLLERLFIGITLVTFISSIWNQITPAIHLRHIWFTLEDQGQACIDSLKGISEIRTKCMNLSLKKRVALAPLLKQMDDVLEHVGYLEGYGGVATYAHFYKDKTYLKKVVEFYSELDVLVTISSLDHICFPNYVKTLHYDISGAVHPVVGSCVSNNFKAKNAVLTGPNRGGKSTYCKALGLAVLTAQTWGFAWAKQFTLSPFKHFRIALTPTPALGETSTFESEIDFAKSVLSVNDGLTFVMMDEIFHSTNAYDGIKASRIFLSQLYEKPDVVSIISTHYHELATEFDKKASQLCMDARVNEDKKLVYTYKVCEGVSAMSSVLEILEERGLFSPGAVEQKK